VRNGDVCLGYGLRARVFLDNGVEERAVSYNAMVGARYTVL
jgi:hypothetical protein